jgi:hypothetical protein
MIGGKERSSRGDSGEKEGKEVRDLAEADTEEAAELVGWRASFLGLPCL